MNWLQRLEHNKERIDRASDTKNIRRSYTVRIIPNEGKIERHSDLIKYKYQSSEDKSGGLSYVHPIAYLNAKDLLKKQSFPECMTMSPSECLDLFDVLATKFGAEAVRGADPLHLFPNDRFLDRQDIQLFNTSISSFIMGLENNQENLETLKSVISHFPGLSKELMELIFFVPSYPK